MMNVVPIGLLGFGFLLGVKHAFDIDHIAAISTITSNQKSIKKSSLLGMFWGFGHAIALFLVGLIVLLLKIKIPEKIALLAELIVGVMLIILGINILFTINKNKIHIHKHKHGNEEHIHFHSHKLSKYHYHKYIPFKQSFLIGLIHGLAGSAALTLLILATINSTLLGLIYILLFGIGSILGMILISTIISLPFTVIPNLQKTQKLIRLSTGLISMAIGLIIVYGIL
jgi:high-affinity nickel permease